MDPTDPDILRACDATLAAGLAGSTDLSPAPFRKDDIFSSEVLRLVLILGRSAVAWFKVPLSTFPALDVERSDLTAGSSAASHVRREASPPALALAGNAPTPPSLLPLPPLPPRSPPPPSPLCFRALAAAAAAAASTMEAPLLPLLSLRCVV